MKVGVVQVSHDPFQADGRVAGQELFQPQVSGGQAQADFQHGVHQGHVALRGADPGAVRENQSRQHQKADERVQQVNAARAGQPAGADAVRHYWLCGIGVAHCFLWFNCSLRPKPARPGCP